MKNVIKKASLKHLAAVVAIIISRGLHGMGNASCIIKSEKLRRVQGYPFFNQNPLFKGLTQLCLK